MEKSIKDIPFYNRSLDSFSNEIIAEARYVPMDKEGRGGHWVAVMRAARLDVSWPDFVSYGDTEASAIKKCAGKIRLKAKTDPNCYGGLLKRGRYDFSFRLCKYWADVEASKAQPALSAASASRIPTPDQIRSQALIWYYAEVNDAADTIMLDLKNGHYSTGDDCYQATWQVVENRSIWSDPLTAVCALVATDNDEAVFDFGTLKIDSNSEIFEIYSQIAKAAFFQDIRERLVELCRESELDLDEPHSRKCEQCGELTDIDELNKHHQPNSEPFDICDSCRDVESDESDESDEIPSPEPTTILTKEEILDITIPKTLS